MTKLLWLPEGLLLHAHKQDGRMLNVYDDGFGLYINMVGCPKLMLLTADPDFERVPGLPAKPGEGILSTLLNMAKRNTPTEVLDLMEWAGHHCEARVRKALVAERGIAA